MQTNASWLKNTTYKLSRAGIGTARLDALILLEDATGKDRSWLLAHPEFDLESLQNPTLQQLNSLVERRISHEPLAYIRGKTEFYGREFLVNKHVLEPRPESETMIDLALKICRSQDSKNTTFMDVGTGSGALAITLKLEAPQLNILAIDIDKNCLAIAKKNADNLAADVKFLQGDLLEPLRNIKLKTYNLICNLPYVPDNFVINPAAMNEPRLAIFGGQDGLDIYRKLFLQINQTSNKPNFVLTESLPLQHGKLVEIAAKSGYKLTKSDDFIQLFQRAK